MQGQEKRPAPVLRASGASGELRVGYQTAARLLDWQINGGASGWMLRARVAERHALWAEEPAQDLVVRIGEHELRWPGVAPRWEGQDVVVALSGRPAVTVTATA